MAVYVPGDWSTENYKLTLENTAKLTADICLRNGVDPEPLTASQLRLDRSGIISHNLSRIVFGGTTHTDPGPTFPWPLFGERVLHYYRLFEDAVEPEEPDTALLARGSKGSRVGEIQSILNLKVDGDFGPATEAAVKGFQVAQRLDVDGIVGPVTMQRLNAPESRFNVQTSAWFPENLYRGKSANSSYYTLFVKAWQDRFGLVPSGLFDLVLEATTLGFQTGVPGLGADGIVGKQTWGTALKL